MKKACISMINIILIICLSVCLFLPVKYSYAEELNPDNYGTPGDTGSDYDTNFIDRYASKLSYLFFTVAIIIAIICVMFVGIKYITAGVARKSGLQKGPYSNGSRCFYSYISWRNSINHC